MMVCGRGTKKQGRGEARNILMTLIFQSLFPLVMVNFQMTGIVGNIVVQSYGLVTTKVKDEKSTIIKRYNFLK